MKSILIVFGFCLFAPLEIDGTGKSLIEKAIEKHGESVSMVSAIANADRTLNGVLKPLRNGLLGSGGAGFVFRGLRLKDKRPVAIKFINRNKAAYAKREYEMYSYLSAINNSQVEKYGIPTVYYYGKLENLTVMAFTELDETLEERRKMSVFQTYDYLFLIRQFIRQSKYIHSRGIRHNDVKPDNILLKDCQSFLNDYDYASKMNEDSRGMTVMFASLRDHQKSRRRPMDDWESFLYSLCYLLKIPLDWLHKDIRKATKHDMEAAIELFGELKSNRTKILETIEKTQNRVILKVLLLKFAEEVFSDKEIPAYDFFDEMVTAKLNEHYSSKTCFSWITKNMASSSSNPKKIEESIKNANTEIGNLVILNDLARYNSFEYPDVDENFFNKQPNRFFGCVNSPCVQ